ncbi:MAG: ABC transporter ATP-binding protein [Hyphomicrobiaceae bacterium]
MAILELRGVSKRFGGLVAVDDVNLGVEKGTIHGLIGPNGAGKTTLFSLITGFYRPTAGRVRFADTDITDHSTSARARMGLIRTFQATVLFPEMSVAENVQNGMLGDAVGRWQDWVVNSSGAIRERNATCEEILAFTGLSGLRNVSARDLSHGQQRVLGMAIALAAKPQLLLLDEPFTGMTAAEKDSLIVMLGKVRESGTTITLVEHDMRTVMRLCDMITVLNFGRVLTNGTPDEVRRNPEVIAAYLGTEP